MSINFSQKKHINLEVIRNILKEASDGVMITEAEPFSRPGPRILYVNKAYCDMTGYSSEEVLGQTPRILQGPETDRAQLNKLRKHLEQGIAFKGELINYRKNGEKFWTSIHISPIRINGGRIQFFLGIKRDITAFRQNELRLSQYNKQMEEMVQARTLALQDAHKKLAYQYQELQSSIEYAQYIQLALLSPIVDIEKLFPQSFVLLRARDKVNGDFVFATQMGNQKIMAVVDCTGHGVPAAFLSILGHQALTKVIHEQQHTSPVYILHHLQRELYKMLSAGAKPTLNEGMDVAVIRINIDTGALTFAGANRPLFIATKTGVRQLAGSRRGIGGFLQPTPDSTFTENELAYEHGDMLYLTSDGYMDQIGGPRDKRLMRKGFVALLKKACALPVKEQHQFLESQFTAWCGENEQLDDVTVVGIRM